MQENHTPSCSSVKRFPNASVLENDRNVQKVDLPVRYQNNPKNSGKQVFVNQPDIIPSDIKKIQMHPQIQILQFLIIEKFVNSPNS